MSDSKTSSENFPNAPHGDPGRMPTDDEEAAAEKAAAEAPDVSEPYEDMTRRGAETEGEGRIE